MGEARIGTQPVCGCGAPPWASRYSAGSTKSVSRVDETIPPITTVASGRCTSEPSPTFSAIGTKPRLATRAVINTGLSRVNAPSRIASSSGRPAARNWLMKVSITSPLRTATPDSAMNPTPAEIEKGMPRSSSAAIPPESASGTPENTIAESFAERRT